MKLLVVDDSKAMRMIVIRTLRQAGFSNLEIKEAENGALALSAIEQETPDLVLSDWNMPEMDGLELLKNIGAKGLPVKFGFVTSEGTTEMRQLASDAGALFLITKPFNAGTFKEILAEHIS